MSQTVEQTHQTSMDKGAIKELLESDAFVKAMRKNLGLEEQKVKVCDFCEQETEIKQIEKDGERLAAHFCSTCQKVVKDPLIKTRWNEREHSLMDKEGVEMLITNIRGSADKIIFTSRFKTSEIQKIMENFHKKMAHELYESWTEYGIKKSSDAHKIAGITTNLVWGGFNRALEGKTLEGVVNMGDDRTVKKAEAGEEKSGWKSKVGLNG